MIDKSHLKAVLEQYKQDFKQWFYGDEKRGGENFKWKAVKCFKDNWNIDADNFPEMLHRALNRTDSLLASAGNYPRKVIEGFSEAAPEEVRAMFVSLYDEDRDVCERIEDFKHKSDELLKNYGGGVANHYQNENVISIYLWLHDPGKYYIYKFGTAKAVARELKSDYTFKKGAYADNIKNFQSLYDEIAEELKADAELENLLNSLLTDDFHNDEKLHTLTSDFGFYIDKCYNKTDAAPVPDKTDLGEVELYASHNGERKLSA